MHRHFDVSDMRRDMPNIRLTPREAVHDQRHLQQGPVMDVMSLPSLSRVDTTRFWPRFSCPRQVWGWRKKSSCRCLQRGERPSPTFILCERVRDAIWGLTISPLCYSRRPKHVGTKSTMLCSVRCATTSFENGDQQRITSTNARIRWLSSSGSV
jgi:hypothetical protein